jgi:hypothetical protein
MSSARVCLLLGFVGGVAATVVWFARQDPARPVAETKAPAPPLAVVPPAPPTSPLVASAVVAELPRETPPAALRVPPPAWPRDLGGEQVQRRLIVGEILPPAPLASRNGPLPHRPAAEADELPLPVPELSVPAAPAFPPLSARPSAPAESLPLEFGPPAIERAQQLRPTLREKK